MLVCFVGMAAFAQGLQISLPVIRGVAIAMIHVQHTFPKHLGGALEAQSAVTVLAVVFAVPAVRMFRILPLGHIGEPGSPCSDLGYVFHTVFLGQFFPVMIRAYLSIYWTAVLQCADDGPGMIASRHRAARPVPGSRNLGIEIHPGASEVHSDPGATG